VRLQRAFVRKSRRVDGRRPLPGRELLCDDPGHRAVGRDEARGRGEGREADERGEERDRDEGEAEAAFVGRGARARASRHLPEGRRRQGDGQRHGGERPEPAAEQRALEPRVHGRDPQAEDDVAP
jgi:hypothetical protein